MQLRLACYLCVSMFLFSPRTRAQQEQNVQVIQMTAKKYEFSPFTLRVKQGTKVRLKITAIDRDHGLTIATVPVGADPTTPAGLEFTSPQHKDNWKLRKGKETTVEFVTRTVGTYEFSCSVTCGWGHARMKGQLVVDP